MGDVCVCVCVTLFCHVRLVTPIELCKQLQVLFFELIRENEAVRKRLFAYYFEHFDPQRFAVNSIVAEQVLLDFADSNANVSFRSQTP